MLVGDELQSIQEIARKIRVHTIKMTYSAKSGHPGGSLSIADILAVLYFKVLNVNPEHPDDPKRDRFILSKGHASPALYAALALRGFFPVELLSGFRKIDSDLEGHVHRGIPGVEASTGSLGQGLGIGVGMALSGRINSLDYKVVVALGDGEMDEGNIWESMMAASKFKLANLIAILDRNKIQLDGYTEDIMPLGNIADKVRSFGWNVIEIDGHNVGEIYDSLKEAYSFSAGPTFVIANTTKGKGVTYMEGNPKYHGKPPQNEEEYIKALSDLGEKL